MPSKKHYTPFVKSFPHFSTKGSDFLQGKLKTYFGPGHKPNMLATPWTPGQVSPNYEDDRYVNPSDWPKSGMVLRAPQIVWIDICVWDAHMLYNPSNQTASSNYFALNPTTNGPPADVDQKAL